MTDDETIAQTNRILARMSTGKPFRYGDLGSCERSSRIADRLIQQWRRRGWITYHRNGAAVIWNLTEAGREAIKAREAKRGAT